MLILDVAEGDAAAPAPAELTEYARQNGLGLVVLAGAVEMDIAQMAPEEQKEFVASLGLDEPAAGRFIRAAYALCDLISVSHRRRRRVPRLAPAQGLKCTQGRGQGPLGHRARLHPRRGRRCEDLTKLGSEAKCREAGKLRLEGKEYLVPDGDVINFRFNV